MEKALFYHAESGSAYCFGSAFISSGSRIQIQNLVTKIMYVNYEKIFINSVHFKGTFQVILL